MNISFGFISGVFSWFRFTPPRLICRAALLGRSFAAFLPSPAGPCTPLPATVFSPLTPSRHNTASRDETHYALPAASISIFSDYYHLIFQHIGFVTLRLYLALLPATRFSLSQYSIFELSPHSHRPLFHSVFNSFFKDILYAWLYMEWYRDIIFFDDGYFVLWFICFSGLPVDFSRASIGAFISSFDNIDTSEYW